MKKINNFIITTLIGGVVVILPIAILIIVISWLFNLLIGIIEPFTGLIPFTKTIPTILVDLFAMAVIIIFSFVVGLFIKTRVGRTVYGLLETNFLDQLPFYPTIKETVQQFVGREQVPFSKVCLVDVFGTDTLMTGFVTEEHPDGRYTVFVPTGPNPTTGAIYHLKPHQISFLEVSAETGMRTVISCGSGSKDLFEKVKPRF